MLLLSRTSFRHIGIAFALLFTVQILRAQSPPEALNIAAKAIYYDEAGAVIIRWAPMDWETWKWGNTEGYDLIRYTIIKNGDTLNGEGYEANRQELALALKPLPENEWESLAESNDLAGVAAGAIYGDSLDLLPPQGANLMTVYHKSQERENRFGFSLFAADQDFTVAEKMGLAFVDQTVEAQSQYVYFIRPHAPDTSSTVRDGFVMVQTDSAFVLPAPEGLKGAPGDSTAVLQWHKNPDFFTSYVVERSTNGVNFSQINDLPLISASAPEGDDGTLAFADSLYANGVTFTYRVRGYSPFGLLGPPSDTVQVTGRPAPLSVLMSIKEIEETQTGELTVTWEFPETEENKVSGFDVYRAKAAEGPFSKITSTTLAASVRTFVDTDPLPANYYQVRTIDENDYELSTFPRLGQPKDDTPPSAPASVFGQANASGVVTLHWTRSPETDVMGYRVFMANSMNGDYAQVSSVWINDTTFLYQLNLNTLSQYIYFTVKALDFRQNQSPMSTPAQIERPDIIPPSAPLITEVTATPLGIQFSWITSSSTDVLKHEFQRKTVGAPGWTVMTAFNVEDPITGYLDSTASKRKWYQYRLVAEDKSGNRGGSRIVKAKPINDGLREPIQNFDGQLVNSTPTHVLLEWDYPKDEPDLTGFQIFRGLDTANMFSYRFFPTNLPQSPSFSDMAVTLNGNLMHYSFTDYDVHFEDFAKTTFNYFYTDALNPNLALPPSNPGNPPPSPGTVQQYTIPNPAASMPGSLKYWVMAKFADGSYSPLAGPVTITL